MATDSIEKTRRDSANQVARSVATDARNASPPWLKPAILIGGVVVVGAALWLWSGDTTTAAEHCRSGAAGLESCALKPTEAVITCGWIKCGGLFSSASESTHDRFIREERMRRAEQKLQRERERVERVLEGELTGRIAASNPSKSISCAVTSDTRLSLLLRQVRHSTSARFPVMSSERQ